MLAAILICGASVFTSCSNDDDPATKSDLGFDSLGGNKDF